MCGSRAGIRTQPPGANSVSSSPSRRCSRPPSTRITTPSGWTIYLEYLQRLPGKRAKEGKSEYGRLPGVPDGLPGSAHVATATHIR